MSITPNLDEIVLALDTLIDLPRSHNAYEFTAACLTTVVRHINETHANDWWLRFGLASAAALDLYNGCSRSPGRDSA